MFRYVQETSEKKSRWRCFSAVRQLEQVIDQYPMQTVLAVSAQVDEIDPEVDSRFDPNFSVKEMAYRGPLYFDVDALDINAAMKSTNELVNKLLDSGVVETDIHIWATGKKGFHVLVPQEVFGLKPTTKVIALPLIYREMAVHFFVEGLDMSVYSCGRGRMWRTPGFKRPDNGKYKVPITIEELQNLDASKYDALVSFPREIERGFSGVLSASMYTLYTQCKKQVQIHLAELKENVVTVTDEELKSFSANDGCIQKLISEGPDGRTSFNQAALQLAAFIKAKWQKSDKAQWEPLVDSLATNGKSTAYVTQRDRKQHILGAVHRVFADHNFKFSRRALFKVIRPCGNCPICKSAEGADKESEDFDCIQAEPHGYFATYGGGAAKQMTNFLIEPLSFQTFDTGDRGLRRTGIRAILKWIDKAGQQVQQETLLSDDAWTSRSQMIKEVSGISNLVVYATDMEIQRLKYHVCRALDDIAEIREMPSMGIHPFVLGRRYTLVYVEPNWSIMASKEQNTCKLSNPDIPAPANFEKVPEPDWGSEDTKIAIHGLLNMNYPHVIAQTLGWVSACFLKVQITSQINQFPLLNLHGNAGSGKSKTAHLLGYLHGCDYEMRDSPLDLETATPYAITAMVASSTTVMRILDECNQTLLRPPTWAKLQGILKAAWAGLEETKGTVGKDKNLHVSRVKLSGPVCFLSEQKPERPAIRQRSVMVAFTERGRKGREKHFMDAFTRRKVLVQLGKEMMQAALTCRPDWILKQMQKYADLLPSDALGPRPLYSFTVVFAGLEFLKKVQEGLGLGIEADIDRLIESLLGYIKDNSVEISLEKSRSESDIVIEAMATMVVQPDNSPDQLRAEDHYFVRGDRLLIDTQGAYPFISRFIRSTTGERAPITSAMQLESLLRGENYFINTIAHPIRPGNTVIALDMKVMEKRGIQVGNFRFAGEDV